MYDITLIHSDAVLAHLQNIDGSTVGDSKQIEVTMLFVQEPPCVACGKVQTLATARFAEGAVMPFTATGNARSSDWETHRSYCESVRMCVLAGIYNKNKQRVHRAP